MTTLVGSSLERNPNFVAMVTMPDGSTYRITRLLASGKSNAKLKKNGARYLTLGLSLAPHKMSGLGTLCSNASPG
jgi:hypothetical protein